MALVPSDFSRTFATMREPQRRPAQTGFQELDRLTGGLEEGSLWVITPIEHARMTIFGYQVAAHVAATRRRTLLVDPCESEDRLLALSLLTQYRTPATLSPIATQIGPIDKDLSDVDLDFVPLTILGAEVGWARHMASLINDSDPERRPELLVVTNTEVSGPGLSASLETLDPDRHVDSIPIALRVLARTLRIAIIAVVNGIESESEQGWRRRSDVFIRADSPRGSSNGPLILTGTSALPSSWTVELENWGTHFRDGAGHAQGDQPSAHPFSESMREERALNRKRRMG